jgi:prevent-host-death family protein
MAWQLQEAKQRFSEVVRRALADGPQPVTRRGEEVVIVISAKEYARLSGRVPRLQGLFAQRARPGRAGDRGGP